MATKDELSAIEFGPMDLRSLEDIAVQLAACKTASEQKTSFGRTQAGVLGVFLKMVSDNLGSFVKDLRDRMAAKAKATT